ncbi:hypothetical protein OGAPHI_003876 [Ogataea philodendri]|uniref:Uncharacterized protein n=1 Tax=Ogataea philodendri TaxID=1378263 RepID=A0A9P8T490_9ASCO|nr:uncharacterized protein OGAPHI_003876 [Ogataea philodendri]KAH3665688.1 hypothetical protein OGAPHI_003876 [Ogataea philodendri]
MPKLGVSSLNPSNGSRELDVTNLRNLERIELSNSSSSSNRSITVWSFIEKPPKAVFFLRSSMLISRSPPEINLATSYWLKNDSHLGLMICDKPSMKYRDWIAIDWSILNLAMQ